jgi:hypothetical protein
MKSFKKYVSEVAEPISPEEKKFKDQHKVVVDKHPVALDHQHTGDTKKPKAKRKADQEGDANYDLAYEEVVYEAKEDDEPASPDESSMAAKQTDFIQYVGREVGEHIKAGKEFPEWMQNKLSAVHQAAKDLHATLGGHGGDDMDEACSSTKYKKEELSPAQKKIDKNKNGKIDGHDLAMLRAKKKNEEVEQIDEISTNTLKRYVAKADKQAKKAADSYSNAAAKRGDFAKDTPAMAKNAKKFAKRDAGADLARKKLAARNEEVELDEALTAAQRRAIEDHQDKMREKSAAKKAAKNKNVKSVKGKYGYGKMDDVDEAFGDWQVKTNKITKTYKARHAGEALRKAKSSGHFGNIALDAKHVSKVNEEVEQIDEAVSFKKGPVRLGDGKQVMVSAQDAELLNQMFKNLDPRNRTTMSKFVVKNKDNFAEILDFAKQAN